MQRRGFTLVELVLVAAIMAVLSAIAIPRYSGSLANMRVSMAARRIVSDVAMAQVQARSVSASRTVRFTPEDASYTVVGISGFDGGASYTVNLGEDPYRAGYTIALTGQGPANRLSFDGYGRPSRGATITITSGSARRIVEVDPESGAAKVTP